MPIAAYEEDSRERGEDVSPVVPPKSSRDETATTSFRTTVGLLEELDLVAEQEGRSRNEILNYCVDWALSQHWREKGVARPEEPAKALKALRDKRKR